MKFYRSLAFFSLLPLALSACSSQESATTAESSVTATTAEASAEVGSSSPTPQATTDSTATTQESSAEPTQNSAPVASDASPAAQEVAAANGTHCGLSNTGASTLVVAENYNGVSCQQVQSIFAEFNSTFTSGDTSNYEIQGYTCHTRSQGRVYSEGRSVTCTQGATRLEAILDYSLGGIPVASNESFMLSSDPMMTKEIPPSVETSREAESGEGYIQFITDIGFCALSKAGSGEAQTSCVSTADANGNFRIISMGENSVTGNEGKIASGPQAINTRLPAGYSISAFGISCINQGDSITCKNANKSFTMTADSYTVSE